MSLFSKARILSESGKYDSCGPKACEVNIEKGLGGIYTAKAEHKTCRLFKTLMTNACKFDCKYCQNSNCKNRKTATYKPKELAKLFTHLQKKLDVHGLFLSSAVGGDVDKISEKMIKAVEILRFKYKFRGYIHFKVLPGTSYELIKQASELSNRMSINIEAPNKSALSEVSSCKDYKIDILRRQAWISKLSKSQTTQMIVNKFSSDKDILKMLKWEYEKLKLDRIYFAAFKPVKGTPMENIPAEKESRQNHLYNIDFLIRRYGYSFKEIENVLVNEMLPNEDPKLAMAKANFDKPVDINDLDYEQLIRVPGIGPITAKRILNKNKINSFRELRDLGGSVKRALPFVKIRGQSQRLLTDF